jgi:ribosomal protein S18 acetylase RimI-like enzyme
LLAAFLFARLCLAQKLLYVPGTINHVKNFKEVISIVIIKKETSGDRSSFLPLLLLADESEEVVKEYIDKGILYTIWVNSNVAGVVQLIELDDATMEIKNIALKPEDQGKGYGKKVLQMLVAEVERLGKKSIIVGTANSSIDNIIFYQKCGFRMVAIKEDFFLDYPEPIYENGIQAVDMIMFKLDIRQN